MEKSEVFQLLKEMGEVWNVYRDWERFAAFWTDDLFQEDLALEVVNRGKEDLRRFFADNWVAWPDSNIRMKSLLVADDRVAFEWLWTATQAKEWPGLIPATGKRFSVRGASVFELEGGKVKGWRDYYNLAAILRQIEAWPKSPPR